MEELTWLEALKTNCTPWEQGEAALNKSRALLSSPTCGWSKAYGKGATGKVINGLVASALLARAKAGDAIVLLRVVGTRLPTITFFTPGSPTPVTGPFPV